jgi:hypothetical protein
MDGEMDGDLEKNDCLRAMADFRYNVGSGRERGLPRAVANRLVPDRKGKRFASFGLCCPLAIECDRCQ